MFILSWEVAVAKAQALFITVAVASQGHWMKIFMKYFWNWICFHENHKNEEVIEEGKKTRQERQSHSARLVTMQMGKLLFFRSNRHDVLLNIIMVSINTEL